MAASIKHVPVLIVGGGPIGLALAAYLGGDGVETLLVETNEDKLGSAKMIVVSVRTMEFCRALGIAPAVRDWGFPHDYPLDSVFVTDLHGYELGRVATPPLSVAADTPFSPERERPCPQTWFDPIVQRHARTFPSVTLRYNTRLESFVQDEAGVTVELSERASGARETIRADYLVGCDGYASTVRDLLGIEVRGVKQLDLSMSVYVRISELRKHHDKGDAYRYVFVGEEGVWSVLTTMDGRDLWRLQLIGANEIDVRKHDVDAALARCFGRCRCRPSPRWPLQASTTPFSASGHARRRISPRDVWQDSSVERYGDEYQCDERGRPAGRCSVQWELPRFPPLSIRRSRACLSGLVNADF